ncbi:hypothetical protein PTNB73_01516 [Pyrenophora teres f. teres]|nr:hypothetical protein PTNB73_01516 [Pyrenophora teres f. teres]
MPRRPIVNDRLWQCLCPGSSNSTAVRAYRPSDTAFAANDSFFTQPGVASTSFRSLGDSPHIASFRRPREQFPVSQLPTHVLYEHARAEGAKGHFDDVMNICRILVKDRGEQPNREMYTAILHSFVDCTNGTAGKVRKVLEEMGFWNDTDGSMSGRPKIEPDARACECVLEVLAVHPDYLLRTDILEYMKSRWLALSDRARNFVVAGMLRERHFEHALSMLEDMVKNNIRVESWLFEKAMWILLEFGEAEEAFYVLNLRADVQSRGNATAASKLSDALWGALLDAAAQANLYQEANMVWTTQVQPGYLKPATGACLSVLTTASRHGDVQLATDVFRLLTERETTITTHQYEMLITTYLKANDLSAALSVILIMVDANLKVDEGTCHPLYWHLFTQKHSGDSLPMQAFSLLQDFEAAGRKVPTAAVNACMQASIALDRLEEAVEMYKALHTVSHAGPNTNTFNILFRGCRRHMRKELAMFFANEMMQLGCKPDRLTYDRLILVCLECGDVEGALLYYEEMTSANATGTNKGGMKPRKRTWERLILGTAVQGDERAVRLLKAYKEGVDEPHPRVEKAVIDRVESGVVPIVAAASEEARTGDMSSAAVEDQHVRLATGFTGTPEAGADTELSDDSREWDPPGGRS